jgi:hypothetical protein
MSMQEIVEFNNIKMSKADVVAMITNIMIDELIIRSSRHNEVRHYYDIALIGYQGELVINLLDEGDVRFTPITQLSTLHPEQRDYCFEQRISKSETIYANFVTHEWIKPRAEGKTPMYEALIEVYNLVDEWCMMREHHDSFPPIIFHITDGNATDCTSIDLINIAENIKRTRTNDGNTLLVNVHIGSGDDICSRGMLFPAELDSRNSSERMHTLFTMSSEVPASLMHQLPISHDDELRPRLVAYNISPCELLNIINIGSESVNE